MKRLLSVVAILLLAASLLPVKGQAGLRGAFDPITNGDNLIKGKFQPALRGAPASGAGTAASPRVERWLSAITLSSVVGSESTGEIWLWRNVSQAFFALEADPLPLLRDETAAVSYIDPAWSKDGKWLAYVQTDNAVTQSSIFVQQFDNVFPGTGDIKLGSPILVADGTGGVHHRHPAWNPSATQIAYDSDAFGLSIDIWTVNVSLDAVAHTGTVDELSRARHTTNNSKGEFKPAYSPDGTKLAFVTNLFGNFTIQILTLADDTFVGAEVNPALVTHDNPSWSSNGQSLYYDAPSSEDPANPQDIWKLDFATGQKCPISIDLAGDTDPDVSQYTSVSSDGIPFNFFLFISQGGGLGLNVWRSEFIQSCIAPLPMAVVISPNSINAGGGGSSKNQEITANLSFPASTRAAGFVCRAANAGGEGIRMRRSIINSPTMLGIRTKSTPQTGDCTNMDMLALFGDSISCFDVVNVFFGNIGKYDVVLDPVGNDHHMNVYWRKDLIVNQIVALGLTDKVIPLEVRAYSNRIGRQFQGFGFVRVHKAGGAGSMVALQQNYPNPFNPSTTINFAVDSPGNVSVRVFNTRGELVRTVTNQWYPQGSHSVRWDGKTQSGGHAPSGIYYIKADTNRGADMVKAVLAK